MRLETLSQYWLHHFNSFDYLKITAEMRNDVIILPHVHCQLRGTRQKGLRRKQKRFFSYISRAGNYFGWGGGSCYKLGKLHGPHIFIDVKLQMFNLYLPFAHKGN
jgi:hypothetical protein